MNEAKCNWNTHVIYLYAHGVMMNAPEKEDGKNRRAAHPPEVPVSFRITS